MARITDCVKNEKFWWTPAITKTFKEVIKLTTEALVMRLTDFLKTFEVICDASGLVIGGVLSQKNHLIAYFSEKLNDARGRYSTYDNEFYAVMQVLLYRRQLSATTGICVVFES